MIPLVKYWCFCDIPEQSRAAAGGILRSLLYNASAADGSESFCSPTPLAAFEKALSAAEEGDTVVVFGSFYTVGPILENIQSACDGAACAE